MAIRMIKLGEPVPEVGFQIKEGAQFKTIYSSQIFKDQRVLVLGIPGPFWTDYPASMVQGYEYHYSKFIKMGIDQIFVTSTTDIFVLTAWLRNIDVKNIQPLPDGNQEWAVKTGLLVDCSESGMGFRSHRYAMVVENGVMKKVFYEDFSHDPHTCFTETNAEKTLAFIEKNQETWMNFSKKKNHDASI